VDVREEIRIWVRTGSLRRCGSDVIDDCLTFGEFVAWNIYTARERKVAYVSDHARGLMDPESI
jgi:hypothetical protein